MAGKLRIYEFSQQIGLSVGTVSRAINGHKAVSPKTREMVLQKMKELGFQPSRAAKALASGQTGTIGFWSPGLASAYATKMLWTLERVLDDHGYDIVVADVGRKREDHFKLASLIQWPVDGVMVLGGEETEKGWLSAFIEASPPLPMPLVSVGGHATEIVDHVALDMSEAVAQAIRHLAEEGCKRIAYLVPENHCRGMHGTGYQRRKSYLDQLERLGLEPEFIFCESTFRPAVSQSLRDYVRRHGCPDGIFCFNDEVALGAYRGLNDSGIRVPDHVLLVGCDGIEETEYMDRPLSTIVAPTEELCSTAWEFLSRRIKQPDLPKQAIVLKSQLVVRETSRR